MNNDQTLKIMGDLIRSKIMSLDIDLSMDEYLTAVEDLIKFHHSIVEKINSPTPSKDGKEPFEIEIRENRKGMKKTKQILKPGINTPVSQSRINGMINAFKGFDVGENILSSYIGKRLRTDELLAEDMHVLVDLYKEVEKGTPINDIISPF